MSFFVILAHWTQYDYAARAKKLQKIQLVSISYSHYCELARWALQLQGIPYEEHKYSPVQHVLPVIAARIPSGGKKYLPKTTKTLLIRPESNLDKANKNSGATSVPVCVLNNGDTLLDSWDIAAFSGMSPISDEIKNILDVELGPFVRHYTYTFILKPSNRNVFDQLCTANHGWGWKLMWWLGIGNYTAKLMAKMFRVGDTELIQKCRAGIRKVFDTLGDKLLASGGPYIEGKMMGIVDIAVASLAAVVVFPDEYGEGDHLPCWKLLEKQDPGFAEDLQYWRQTVIGKFCLFMYKEHRMNLVK